MSRIFMDVKDDPSFLKPKEYKVMGKFEGKTSYPAEYVMNMDGYNIKECERLKYSTLMLEIDRIFSTVQTRLNNITSVPLVNLNGKNVVDMAVFNDLKQFLTTKCSDYKSLVATTDSMTYKAAWTAEAYYHNETSKWWSMPPTRTELLNAYNSVQRQKNSVAEHEANVAASASSAYYVRSNDIKV